MSASPGLDMGMLSSIKQHSQSENGGKGGLFKELIGTDYNQEGLFADKEYLAHILQAFQGIFSMFNMRGHSWLAEILSAVLEPWGNAFANTPGNPMQAPGESSDGDFESGGGGGAKAHSGVPALGLDGGVDIHHSMMGNLTPSPSPSVGGMGQGISVGGGL